MDDQREVFEDFCLERYVQGDVHSKTLTKAKGAQIVAVLNDSATVVPVKFRAWVKQRGFRLMSYAPLGLKDVLCLPAKKKNPNDPTILANWRRVVYVEDLYEVIRDVHCREKGHIGGKKTVEEISKLYECVPRSAVDKFVQLCLICHARKPQSCRAPLKPIISSGFMTRGQIDLIDMRHRPDGHYKWIGHYMDHWSKFHVVFPLMRKSAEEVGLNLQNHVFSLLGTPRILHSDNGREFVNEIVHTMVKDWPGEVVIVNGRPRNPKCQGLIEQGNHQVEKLLGARLYESKADIPAWTEWLPLIQYQLNTTVHGTMKTTPYELVFGQPPRQNVFPGVSQKTIMEEDVEDLFTDDGKGQEEDEKLDGKGQEEDGKGQEEDEKLDGKGQEEDGKEEEEDEKLDGKGEEEEKILATSTKHRGIREKADQLYRRNAEYMKLKYTKGKRKKVLTFSPGDLASVRIPRIDRSSTDFHRLPCVVVEKLWTEFHLYRLRCAYGVLKTCFSEGDMELIRENSSLMWRTGKRIELSPCVKQPTSSTPRMTFSQVAATVSLGVAQSVVSANRREESARLNVTVEKNAATSLHHQVESLYRRCAESSLRQGRMSHHRSDDVPTVLGFLIST